MLCQGENSRAKKPLNPSAKAVASGEPRGEGWQHRALTKHRPSTRLVTLVPSLVPSWCPPVLLGQDAPRQGTGDTSQHRVQLGPAKNSVWRRRGEGSTEPQPPQPGCSGEP